MKTNNILLLSTLALLALITIVSCDEGCQQAIGDAFVEIPESDETPPTLTWEVVNHATGAINTYTAADNYISIPYGTDLEVRLIANDEEGGIRKMTLGGGFSYSCRNDDRLGLAVDGLSVTDVADFSDVTDLALRRWLMIQRIDLNVRCPQQGLEFSGGSYRLRGTGENFHGGAASSSITISVTS